MKGWTVRRGSVPSGNALRFRRGDQGMREKAFPMGRSSWLKWSGMFRVVSLILDRCVILFVLLFIAHHVLISESLGAGNSMDVV